MALDRPVELLVFVAQGCPFCARAIESAQQVATQDPRVRLEIVDVGADPPRAQASAVTSVPLTILDGELRKTGWIPAADLARWVRERGSPEHAARLLAAAVEEGGIGEGVERLLAEGGGRAFARAWRSSAMSLRVGLMLLAEEGLERAPHALDAAVPSLLEATSSPDAPLRGDTADLLGRIGHPAARSALEALAEDPVPDVREAAADALDALRA